MATKRLQQSSQKTKYCVFANLSYVIQLAAAETVSRSRYPY